MKVQQRCKKIHFNIAWSTLSNWRTSLLRASIQTTSSGTWGQWNIGYHCLTAHIKRNTKNTVIIGLNLTIFVIIVLFGCLAVPVLEQAHWVFQPLHQTNKWPWFLRAGSPCYHKNVLPEKEVIYMRHIFKDFSTSLSSEQAAFADMRPLSHQRRDVDSR